MSKTNNIKIHIKKGDTVMVISGDDKGTKGEVKKILPESYRAIVEGVRMVKKHQKPTAENPGGIIEKEAPLHISNLMLVDGKGDATRIGRRKEGEKTVRYSKKSGEVIK